MSDEQDTPQIVSEHIVEIRYAPNPKMLDYRGTWTATLINELGLNTWRISENRIDLYNEEQMAKAAINAFASFRNAGVVTRNSTNAESAAELSVKLIRTLFAEKDFGHSVHIERIGVRSRLGLPFNGTFQELRDRYSSRFVQVAEGTKQLLKLLSMEIVDVGGPLDFSTPNGKINTFSGPMQQGQLSEFFGFQPKEKLPIVALYLDLDYWDKPEKELSTGPTLKQIKDYAQFLSELQNELVALILE